MTTARRYDPHRHAEELGITIHYRRLRTANGLYLPEQRVIFLQPRMHRVHERSVLAHEIVHAEFEDVGRNELQERRADRIAARRLICGDDLRAVTPLSDDPGVWALELDVTDHMLDVWLRDQEVRSA